MDAGKEREKIECTLSEVRERYSEEETVESISPRWPYAQNVSSKQPVVWSKKRWTLEDGSGSRSREDAMVFGHAGGLHGLCLYSRGIYDSAFIVLVEGYLQF